MKLLVAIVAVLFLLACSKVPKDELISKCNDYIQNDFLPTLKDPKSYEVISVAVKDTMYLSDFLEPSINSVFMDVTHNKIMIASLKDLIKTGRGKYTKEQNEQDLKEYELILKVNEAKSDSLYSLMSNGKGKKIYRIKIEHKYRAKNGFGGYNIGNSIVLYDPDTNVFSVESAE